jgi:hypothetical protein
MNRYEMAPMINFSVNEVKLSELTPTVSPLSDLDTGSEF